MGLYDFNIHDQEQEQPKLHDVSSDKGETWKTEWLTPSEVLQHRMYGHITRPHKASVNRTIIFFPGNSLSAIKMSFDVPVNRDAEEYIDEYLDGMLNDFLRYNSEWEFEE